MKSGFLIFLILSIFSFYGCNKDSSKEAASLSECPALGCSGKNICLKPNNICVFPCDNDQNCPKGMLCKGYFKDIFKFTGKGNKFCKKSLAKERKGCSRFDSACTKGLACVDGICRKKCLEDRNCKNNEGCLMEVLPTDSFNPKDSYKVCAKSNLEVGENCLGGSEPFCKSGLVCIEGECKTKCDDDIDCPPKRKCSKNGYFGWRGRLRMENGEDPDFKYCE
jgi:hypothetical protein